jgi:hypothetical protein
MLAASVGRATGSNGTEVRGWLVSGRGLSVIVRQVCTAVTVGIVNISASPIVATT